LLCPSFYIFVRFVYSSYISRLADFVISNLLIPKSLHFQILESVQILMSNFFNKNLRYLITARSARSRIQTDFNTICECNAIDLRRRSIDQNESHVRSTVRLTTSRKYTDAAKTVYEFYISLWTKVCSDPVRSRCSTTPGPRQVYIVSRARIPTRLPCGPHLPCYAALISCQHKIVIDTSHGIVI
jgi:hypothetical protein